MKKRALKPVSYTHLDVYKRQMLEGIADGVLPMNGGYKVLTREEISAVLRESMK